MYTFDTFCMSMNGKKDVLGATFPTMMGGYVCLTACRKFISKVMAKTSGEIVHYMSEIIPKFK